MNVFVFFFCILFFNDTLQTLPERFCLISLFYKPKLEK